MLVTVVVIVVAEDDSTGCASVLCRLPSEVCLAAHDVFFALRCAGGDRPGGAGVEGAERRPHPVRRPKQPSSEGRPPAHTEVRLWPDSTLSELSHCHGCACCS